MKAELVSFGLIKGYRYCISKILLNKINQNNRNHLKLIESIDINTLEVMHDVCLTAAPTMIHKLKYQILPPNTFCFLTNDSELILFYRK